MLVGPPDGGQDCRRGADEDMRGADEDMRGADEDMRSLPFRPATRLPMLTISSSLGTRPTQGCRRLDVRLVGQFRQLGFP